MPHRMRPLYKENNKRKKTSRLIDVVYTGQARKLAAVLKWFNAESMLWLSMIYSIRHEGNIGVWP